MSDLWAPGWVESLLEVGVDDAGFAALLAAAEHAATTSGARDGCPRFDSAQVLAVLTGDSRTRRLPAATAAAVAKRLATRDPAAAAHACAGDRRRAVQDALELGAVVHARCRRATCFTGDVSAALDALLAAAGGVWSANSWRNPQVVNVVSALPAPLAADLTVALIASPPPAMRLWGDDTPGVEAAAAVAAVLGLHGDLGSVAAQVGTSPLFTGASAQVRAAVTLAFFVADPNTWTTSRFSGSRSDVAAAYQLSRVETAGLARFSTSAASIAAARPALLAWCAADAPDLVEGPGSLAEIAGLGDLGSASDDDVKKLLAALTCSELTPSSTVAAVITAATQHGKRLRLVPVSALRAASEMPPAVSFAAAADVGRAGAAARARRRWFLTGPALRWPPEVFSEAFDTHPMAATMLLSELVDVALDGALTTLPPAWVAQSMRTVGLEYWVRRYPPAAAELAAAAEGIGAERWATLCNLIGTFRGTPSELVAVTAELAPTH